MVNGIPDALPLPEPEEATITAYTTDSGLRKVSPYWYPHRTSAKERWWGRQLLEVVSTEFRERSTAYYRHALESGVTTINGQRASPDTIIQNGDLLENITHRHEPPVTSAPVRVVHRDDARSFIVVDKPGSIPVHATGRFFKNTMVEILKDQGVDSVYTVNRLDRLTSGLLILPTTAAGARALTDEFFRGDVHKEYVARCLGEFPVEEVVCEQPLVTVDRQMGLNIVHPEGKHAKTIFTRLHYDSGTNTSVVRAQPVTGRSHQIRVHLQFLGHPIANDTLYCDPHIWGPKLGRGGLDVSPSSERAAPAAPAHLSFAENPEARAATETDLLPRETGHDIGAASPVPLSAEAVRVIMRLRARKDADEGWARWRDVAFRAHGLLRPRAVVRTLKPPPTPRQKPTAGRKKRRAVAEAAEETAAEAAAPLEANLNTETSTKDDLVTTTLEADVEPPALLVLDTTPVPAPEELEPKLTLDETQYCTECFLPLPPDPAPEQLYIFLHALRYTTALGTFATDLPAWAAPDYKWTVHEPVQLE